MNSTFCLQLDRDMTVLTFYFFRSYRFFKNPFELLLGQTVRGPLKLIKEKWLTEHTDLKHLDYVSRFKEKCILLDVREFLSLVIRYCIFSVPGHPVQAK